VGPSPGSTNGLSTLTFQWTFAGATCAQTPAVASVQVTMPGQQFASNGLFACDTAGYDGISLTDFSDGTYPYTLTGLAQDGATVLYSASGTVTINGSDVSTTVALQPVAGSFAYLSWTFPDLGGVPQSTCQAAGVTTVNVSVDQQAAVPVPCASGQTAPGYATATLDAGTHSVSLSALDGFGFQRYATTGTFVTSLSQPTSQGLSLQWTVGEALLGFTLENAQGVAESCSAAGVSNLLLQVYDSHGAPQFSGLGQTVSCAAGSVGVQLPTGAYSAVFSAAVDGGTFSSGTLTPVTFTTQAGIFPSATCVPVNGTDCVDAGVKQQ